MTFVVNLQADGAELCKLDCVSNKVHQDLLYSPLISNECWYEIWQLTLILVSNHESLYLRGKLHFILRSLRLEYGAYE